MAEWLVRSPLYPFTPALVQVLVSVSSVLQRERTALKVMLQLLVNGRGTLALGDLVPVGDLFDVIAEGDEAFSEGMRQHFENAQRLWLGKLRPLLEQQHGVKEEDLSLPGGDPRATCSGPCGRSSWTRYTRSPRMSAAGTCSPSSSVFAKLAGRPLQRVGLSATVGNPERVLEWLAHASVVGRQVVTAPSSEVPDADVKVDFVGSLENAATVISRLHRGEKQLVFCDSRARVEDLATTAPATRGADVRLAQLHQRG